MNLLFVSTGWRSYTLLLCLACGFVSSSAQFEHVTFKHLTPENGLPLKSITTLAQDRQGFLWVGTIDGLFRFDGFNFKAFPTVAGNSMNLPGDIIQKIYADKAGFIWVGTNRGGLCKIDLSGRVLKVFNSFTCAGFSNFSDRIHDIVEDDKGCIWVTSSDGIFRFFNGGDSVVRIGMEQDRKFNCLSNAFGNINFDEKGRLWTGSRKGVHIYDPERNEFQHSENNPDSLRVLEYPKNTAAIYYDPTHKQVWCSFYEPSLKLFDLKSGKCKIFYSVTDPAKADYSWIVRTFYRTGSGRLWLITSRGAYLTNTARNGLDYRFSHVANNASSIIDDFLNAVLEDKDGTTWFASREGMSYTRMLLVPFINYLKAQADSFPFAGKEITDVTAIGSNHFLVSTYGEGIYATDSNFKLIRQFSFDDNAYDWIWNVCREKVTGEIYFTAQRGVFKYIPSVDEVQKLQYPPFDTAFAFSSVLQQEDGWMWFSNYRNVFYKYHPLTRKYKRYRLRDLGIEDQVIRLGRASDENLWIVASNTGLLKFSPKQEKIIEHVFARPDPASGLLQSEVGFVKEFDGNILIGYDEDGFRWYSKEDRIWNHYRKVDGLISNLTRDAEMDQKGRVWIGTQNGLSSFDPVLGSFSNYSTLDGIGNTDFVSISILPDGRIAAGTKEGLVVFQPDGLKYETRLEPPVITELSVYGKQLPADSFLKVNQAINILFRKNYFSVEYISPQFLYKHQVEYSYKLEGLHKDWIYAGTRRFTSFSNLPGGNYVFKVRARYRGGDWIESNQGLAFDVHSAFYKSWWFYVFLLIPVGGSIYYLHHLKIRRLQGELVIRNKIARDLHDDVGSTLSGIKLISSLALKKVQLKEEDAAVLVSGIVQRSEQLMDNMNDIVWSINPRHDLGGNMLLRMKEYAAEMLEPAGIEYSFVSDEKLNKAKLNLNIRKDIYFIFKEVINNMVKHAQCKLAVIELRLHNDVFEMKIKDNGKGFIVDRISGRGNGMHNLRERARQINGSIEIHSVPAEGTVVRLQVPVT